jgi:hypothetical protein
MLCLREAGFALVKRWDSKSGSTFHRIAMFSMCDSPFGAPLYRPRRRGTRFAGFICAMSLRPCSKHSSAIAQTAFFSRAATDKRFPSGMSSAGVCIQFLEEKLKVEKQGFHGFRRFRLTWLRKNHVPGDLERFWMGHSDQEVGDLYSKMEEDTEFCQTVAESVGLGFELPQEKTNITRNVAPIAPKTALQEQTA